MKFKQLLPQQLVIHSIAISHQLVPLHLIQIFPQTIIQQTRSNINSTPTQAQQARHISSDLKHLLLLIRQIKTAQVVLVDFFQLFLRLSHSLIRTVQVELSCDTITS